MYSKRVLIDGLIDDIRVQRYMEFVNTDAETVITNLRNSLSDGVSHFSVVDSNGIVFAVNLHRAKVINLVISDVTS